MRPLWLKGKVTSGNGRRANPACEYRRLAAQAVEARTTEVCGVDMSAINRNRWTPAFAAGDMHIPQL